MSGRWEAAVCTPKTLLPGAWMAAATRQRLNRGTGRRPAPAADGGGLRRDAEHLAVLTTKYWPAGTLIPSPSSTTPRPTSRTGSWARQRLGETANIAFVPAAGECLGPGRPLPGGGYWSLLGTDHRLAATGQIEVGTPAGETLNLDCSRWGRPTRIPPGGPARVRHAQVPARAQPPEIVALLDLPKVIAYFEATQGWSRR
ncbi:MAG: hypothetical protein WKF75_12600 [Singulisphaera sp.]